MRRIVHLFAIVGLLAGGVLVERRAVACASFSQDADGNCACRPNWSTGYDSCTQAGRACVLVGPRCGDSGTKLPP